jgi:hypothetical protein
MSPQERFSIAQDSPKPSSEQLVSQKDIRDAIAHAAFVLESETRPSREQSLALTKLEEALLWAGRAVFQ